MKFSSYQFLLSGLVLLLFVACRQNTEVTVDPPYQVDKRVIEDSAMVVSAHPEASRVGLEILRKGGNAVDAAIAMQFALAVVYPQAGNIGGGGFMVYRNADGTVKTLDYREKAPAAATHDMYLDSAGNAIDELSRYGHLSAGVPGTVAGLFASHEHGKLPMSELIAPAITLAENGYFVTELESKGLNGKQEEFEKYNTTPPVLINKDGWKMGDKIVQPDLAETLKRIQANGKAGFYEGKTAELIVAEMQAGNGIMTLEDLKNYNAIWREPITFDYKGYELYSMPPASSGGVCLAQLLGMVEDLPLADWGFHSPEAVHAIVEAERRAYADRSKHLGDSDFYPVPIAELMDKAYLKERMADFSLEKATSSDDIDGGEVTKESEQTTHLSVVDQWGNAVSVTTTLNSGYGSKTFVSGAGFLLNNEMDDFSAKPGSPNIYGLVGAEANKIEPGKRMLSSMTPTIVTKDDKLFMVVGTPGGSTIITSVFQVFLNVAEFGMTLEEAVQSNRFHHQWLPNKVFIEEGTFSEATQSKLTGMGHELSERGSIGRVDAILIMPDGKLEGVGDRRGDDDAEGM